NHPMLTLLKLIFVYRNTSDYRTFRGVDKRRVSTRVAVSKEEQRRTNSHRGSKTPPSGTPVNTYVILARLNTRPWEVSAAPSAAAICLCTSMAGEGQDTAGTTQTQEYS
ncbi:hypothetical protein OTU49_005662, partial [Cherax quadricarinatus]